MPKKSKEKRSRALKATKMNQVLKMKKREQQMNQNISVIPELEIGQCDPGKSTFTARISRHRSRFVSNKNHDMTPDRNDINRQILLDTDFNKENVPEVDLCPNKAKEKQLINPKPPPDSETEPEEDVPPVPPVPEPVIVSGKRSCTLRRCAFASCPHHAPAAEAPEGITYFPFPKTSHNSARWARIISRAQGEEFKPKLTSVVCSLHFAPWQVLPDGQGGSKLDKTAAPRADPFSQEEPRNIEEVLLPERDPDALDVKVEMEGSDYELRQAVDSIVDIPPPENGIRIQCVGLDDSDNATLHYLSVDKDYTVNHTRVNINKNNIATLNYVDTNCKVNHTLKCIDLNEENISTYEELVKPNITSTHTQEETLKIEITPNTQNTLENSYNFKIKQVDADTSSRNDEHPAEQIENTVQMNSTDDLSVLTTVKSEIFDDSVEIEDVVLETNDEILIKQELNDSDELYVVQMEYED